MTQIKYELAIVKQAWNNSLFQISVLASASCLIIALICEVAL